MRRALLIVCMVLAIAACSREDSKPIQQRGPGSAVVNFDSEINLLKSILKEDPDNLQALIKLGNLQMDSNRFNEAVESYGKALEIDPSNPDVRVDMGTCYRRIGRSDLAVEQYKKAIESNPNHLFAHMNLGVVLAYDFNKKEEAIKAFERFLEIAPNSQNAPQIRQEIERLRSGQ